MAERISPSLVEAVQRGDPGALAQVLTSIQGPIYNICYRMVGHREDAAEVTQETFLKVVEHVHDFRGQSDLLTWITRIAMNLCVSHLRRKKVRQAGSLDAAAAGDHEDQSTPLRAEIADHREPQPASGVEQKEMIANLHKALGVINEDFRAVLVLRDIQEMDYDQIAGVLGLPVGTIKSRLFRGRLALRHEMLRLHPPPVVRPETPLDIPSRAVPSEVVSEGVAATLRPERPVSPSSPDSRHG